MAICMCVLISAKQIADERHSEPLQLFLTSLHSDCLCSPDYDEMCCM